MIFQSVDAWCDSCNQCHEHYLRLVITNSPTSDERALKENIKLVYRAFITCTICLRQYELIPDQKGPDANDNRPIPTPGA